MRHTKASCYKQKTYGSHLVLDNKLIIWMYGSPEQRKVCGNDEGLCGRGVEEVMKGMMERVGVCKWLIEVSFLSDEGFAGDTHRPAHNLFLWPTILLCLHPPLVHPSSLHHPPLPCFHGPRQRGWDVKIYTSVHVCALCGYVHVCGNEDVLRATHRQDIGKPNNLQGYQQIWNW